MSAVGLEQRVEALGRPRLDCGVLDHRLDHQLAAGELADLGGPGDRPIRASGLGCVELAALDGAATERSTCSRERSSGSWLGSWTNTGRPARAADSAIPEPMNPAPTIADARWARSRRPSAASARASAAERRIRASRAIAALGVDDDGVELDQLEPRVEQQRRRPGRRAAPGRSTSSRCAAARPGQQRRCPQRADRALDPRRAGRQRDDRDVVERLRPDPAEPDHQRGTTARAGGDEQLEPGLEAIALDQDSASGGASSAASRPWASRSVRSSESRARARRRRSCAARPAPRASAPPAGRARPAPRPRPRRRRRSGPRGTGMPAARNRRFASASPSQLARRWRRGAGRGRRGDLAQPARVAAGLAQRRRAPIAAVRIPAIAGTPRSANCSRRRRRSGRAGSRRRAGRRLRRPAPATIPRRTAIPAPLPRPRAGSGDGRRGRSSWSIAGSAPTIADDPRQLLDVAPDQRRVVERVADGRRVGQQLGERVAGAAAERRQRQSRSRSATSAAMPESPARAGEHGEAAAAARARPGLGQRLASSSSSCGSLAHAAPASSTSARKTRWSPATRAGMGGGGARPRPPTRRPSAPRPRSRARAQRASASAS